MPRKSIRIEPMNAVKEQPVEQPVEEKVVETPIEEPLPERTNCTEMSDEMLAAIVEEVKNDVGPVAKPKRTRRPKAKAEPPSEEPTLSAVPEEPEPVKETPPSEPVAAVAPAVDDSDVVVTGAAKPDKITCNACGKMLSVKSFKYSHQKTCSGLKGAKSEKQQTETRAPAPSPVRKSEIRFDEEAPSRRHPDSDRVIEVRTHPEPNPTVDVRTQRANMRKERIAKLFSSAI